MRFGNAVRVTSRTLPGVLLFEPEVFNDERGYLIETWSAARYASAGLGQRFVQDNLTRSVRGVLRGLHLQHPFDQGKLVSVPYGEVFDVAVDVRVGSPNFGHWAGAVLSDRNNYQLYIPPGFAHGFCVISDVALFSYKCTELYHPEAELGIRFDDSAIGIPWPASTPLLSAKDRAYPKLADVPRDRLPLYRPEANEQ